MQVTKLGRRLSQKLTQEIAIDLGTATTQVAIPDAGIVIAEPSVVAINQKNAQILAVGEEAKHMAGRTPGHISVVRPLRDGVIADFDATEAIVRYFIQQVFAKYAKIYQFNRPTMLIGVPTVITEVEARALTDAAKSAGARQVYLIEEPIAAAIGAGVDIVAHQGTLIIDIGGGTSDIALISMGGLIGDSTIKVAGDEMNLEIVEYIKHKYNLLISENIAEDLKITYGSVARVTKESELEVVGRDLVSGLPKTLKFSALELRESLLTVIDQICDAAQQILEKAPPEVMQDLLVNGGLLVGGGAQLKGLEKYLSDKLHVQIRAISTPQNAVVLGLLKLTSQLELLERLQVKESRFI